MQEHIEQIRTVAQQEGLSQSCVERIDKAERVVPKMQGTIEFVSRYVTEQVAQLELTPPISFAMHAKLIPSYYLDRVAETRSVSDGAPLRDLAERLRAPLVAPGGALSTLSPRAKTISRTRPSDLPPCSSARAPMWRGETATCRYAAINYEDSTCHASDSASPPCTTFSSPGPTGRRQRSAFLVRNPARCLRRYWTRWSWHPRHSVHLEKHNVADPVIEAQNLSIIIINS